jgi:hypothetical protein
LADPASPRRDVKRYNFKHEDYDHDDCDPYDCARDDFGVVMAVSNLMAMISSACLKD